jgi:multidrug efflux system membrane fusion protein
MLEEQPGRIVSNRESLGHSFVAHNGGVGPSFEDHNATPAKHRTRHRRWVWILALLLLVLVIFLIWHHGNTAKTGANGPAGGDAGAQTGGRGGRRGQTGPAAITVGQSTTGNINIYDDALGTVTPIATVTMYSQITGVVLSVHYREGQIVHKGDPLVDIDPRPYEATLTQAEGTLLRDQGVLAEAKMDLVRYQAAYAKNAIARQQVEDQEKVVIQDQGTVQADQGTVDYDKVQLGYCHIVAPIGGRVGLRLVDPGNTVFSGTGSTLVVITQLQPITVVFDVSEDNLPQIEAQLKGRKTLGVDAFDRSDVKQIESGKLTSLDNEIDTTTGTVKFRATFQNKNFELFPNQFVNARLLVKTLENATLVPGAAVQHNGTAAFVYIVNSNKTVGVQPITTLTSNEQVTAVQGVNPGVNLATSGFDRLDNGAHVLIRPAPGKAAASGQSKAPATPGTGAP